MQDMREDWKMVDVMSNKDEIDRATDAAKKFGPIITASGIVTGPKVKTDLGVIVNHKEASFGPLHSRVFARLISQLKDLFTIGVLSKRGWKWEGYYVEETELLPYVRVRRDKEPCIIVLYNTLCLLVEKDHWRKTTQEFKKFFPSTPIVITGSPESPGFFSEVVRDVDPELNFSIAGIVRACRILDEIPTPKYSDRQLWNSYRALCTLSSDEIASETEVGYNIIDHFHTSLVKCAKKGRTRPFDHWNNDGMLIETIRKLILAVPEVTPEVVAKSIGTRVIDEMSPGEAHMLVKRHLGDTVSIFDPFSGASGRMLGVCAAGKKYLGQDVNIDFVGESRKIKEFFNLNAEINHEDMLRCYGAHPAMFTSPPRGDSERWGVVENAMPAESWIDRCIERFDCNVYLFVVDKPGHHSERVVEILRHKTLTGLSVEYVVRLTRADHDKISVVF
jgi:hypothetical protein